MLSCTFPRLLRLRNRAGFQRVARYGQRRVGKFIIVERKLNPRGTVQRLGITVSRKYGKAHQRNRFKRLVREAFRLGRHAIPPGWDLVVLPRHGAGEPTLHTIQTELLELIA